jgi:dUTP pyrophosphatase
MRIQSLHAGFIMPKRGTEHAGAFDLYMPEAGYADGTKQFIKLGFATEIPVGYAAFLLPRSGTGAKFSLELNNTVGLIDADYRGEWMAALKTKDGSRYEWAAGDRILQFVLVPVFTPELELVESVSNTDRGAGGFGSSGL